MLLHIGVEWRNGGMAEWRNGGMAEWRNGGMAEWRNGGMAEWRNGGMAERQTGGMAEWHNVRYEKVWNQDTESTKMPPWRSPSRLVINLNNTIPHSVRLVDPRQCLNFLVLNVHIPAYLGSRGKPFFQNFKVF
jgi:hypothetical protein